MATIIIAGHELTADSGKTIESVVREAGLLPDAYIFLVNGKPMPMDTPIEDTMSIKAIKVASGG